MLFDLHKEGWIEVICGPMFAGKTEERLRRVNRMEYAQSNYCLFKSVIDSWYAEDAVMSHSGHGKEAIIIKSSRVVLKHIVYIVQAAAIDAVQVFDEHIVK